MKKIVHDGYNQAAENYSSQRNMFKSSPYLERLIALLKPGAKILDIGCGAGIPIDQHFLAHGFQVIGLDLAEKQVELATRNLPEGKFLVADMMDLEEKEFAVDAVVSFYAIFHTPRETHPVLFRKIHSFLPEEGFILITMGADEWVGTEEDFHGVTMFWSHYGAKRNAEIVTQAGFEVLFDEIDHSANEKHQVILAKKTGRMPL